MCDYEDGGLKMTVIFKRVSKRVCYLFDSNTNIGKNCCTVWYFREYGFIIDNPFINGDYFFPRKLVI